MQIWLKQTNITSTDGSQKSVKIWNPFPIITKCRLLVEFQMDGIEVTYTFEPSDENIPIYFNSGCGNATEDHILKMFRVSDEEIIQMIELNEGNGGAEPEFKHFVKLTPEMELRHPSLKKRKPKFKVNITDFSSRKIM